MHRVLVPPSAIQDDTITITDAGTLHHLHVLRVNVGDQVECFDGHGHIYAGAIIQRTRHVLVVAVNRRVDEPPPSVQVTLAQALIKPERFEWVIQKATELGVAQIIPLLTSRTRVRAPARQGTTPRLLRWQRIAEAAATQCGRATIPIIEEPQPFEHVLKSLSRHYGLLFTLEEGQPLGEHLPGLKAITQAAIFIGPEGDFSSEEVALAKRHGIHTAHLGRLVLRSETAALAVLAIIQHELEPLSPPQPSSRGE